MYGPGEQTRVSRVMIVPRSMKNVTSRMNVGEFYAFPSSVRSTSPHFPCLEVLRDSCQSSKDAWSCVQSTAAENGSCKADMSLTAHLPRGSSRKAEACDISPASPDGRDTTDESSNINHSVLFASKNCGMNACARPLWVVWTTNTAELPLPALSRDGFTRWPAAPCEND